MSVGWGEVQFAVVDDDALVGVVDGLAHKVVTLAALAAVGEDAAYRGDYRLIGEL